MKIKELNCSKEVTFDVLNECYTSEVKIDVIDEASGVDGFISGTISLENGKETFRQNAYGNKGRVSTKEEVEKNKTFQKNIESLGDDFFNTVNKRKEINEIYDKIRQKEQQKGA